MAGTSKKSLTSEPNRSSVIPMTDHHTVQVRRGRSKRLVAEFSPATVWAAGDSANPLFADLRGDLSESLVVSDGKRHIVSLKSEVFFL
jgi:hypothetical protein